jgi:hypothetical protein
MIVGQNVPAGRSGDRAKTIAKRIRKLHAEVNKNRAVKESVRKAASLARQRAIKLAMKKNLKFKKAVEKLLDL